LLLDDNRGLRSAPQVWDDANALVRGGLSRRGFLAGATGLSLGLALDACGGSSSHSATTSGGGTPKHGGTLTVAGSGGGSTDTLTVAGSVTTLSLLGQYQLYDGLTYYAADGSVQPLLAEELSPNKDGTQWTIRVRSGITFHDGRPLTSADVIASLRVFAKASISAANFTFMDAAGLKALDTHTVLVPLHKPVFIFPAFLATSPSAFVVPADFNPAHPGRPIGTGPFEYVSFTPGQQMKFARNPNYWQSGKPYLDTIVVNYFGDETAQVNALLSGQANAANSFSLASARSLQAAGSQILTGSTGQSVPLAMNTAVTPLADVRVRQALKLIVDRPQMLKAVFGPYGSIANDSFCAPFDSLYTPLPQRHQDLEQAKSLLRQAGQSGLTFKLTTAPIAQGAVEIAEVFGTQAKDAGVNVTINQVTPDVLFGPNYTKWPFSMSYWTYATYLVTIGDSMVPGASYPETHFNNPRFTSLYYQALGAADLSLRREIAAEMQRIEFDQGGYIAPIFTPILDAHATAVRGLQPGRTGFSFNTFNFRDTWIA
jgi:peptide/nickel transport system substrate-binding protein